MASLGEIWGNYEAEHQFKMQPGQREFLFIYHKKLLTV